MFQNTMLANLFWVILFGGISVLISYYVLMQEDDVSKLWAGLQGTIYYAWLASMCLTILSYFYLFYSFVWADDDAKIFTWMLRDTEPFLCACYTLFLGSASQYAYIAITDIRKRERSFMLLANLWLTALMSLLIGSCAVALNNVSGTMNVLSIVTGLMFALHHVAFDAIFWYQSFDPTYNQIV